MTAPERKKKKNNPSLRKAQHEWEFCHRTACPGSILASCHFLHNCFSVLILIPVAFPTLCYFLKKASKLHVWFNREFHGGKTPDRTELPQRLRENIVCWRWGDGRPPGRSCLRWPLLSASSSRPGTGKFLLCLCHSTPRYHVTQNIKIKLLTTSSPRAIWASLEADSLWQPPDNGIPGPSLYVWMFVIMDFTLMPQLHLWHSFNRVALMTFIIIYAPP